MGGTFGAVEVTGGAACEQPVAPCEHPRGETETSLTPAEKNNVLYAEVQMFPAVTSLWLSL